MHRFTKHYFPLNNILLLFLCERSSWVTEGALYTPNIVYFNLAPQNRTEWNIFCLCHCFNLLFKLFFWNVAGVLIVQPKCFYHTTCKLELPKKNDPTNSIEKDFSVLLFILQQLCAIQMLVLGELLRWGWRPSSLNYAREAVNWSASGLPQHTNWWELSEAVSGGVFHGCLPSTAIKLILETHVSNTARSFSLCHIDSREFISI